MKNTISRHLLPSLTAISLSGFPIPVSAEDAPAPAPLDRAFVTIPYSELRALWEAGHAPKEEPVKPAPPPPVPYLIGLADCQVQLGEAITSIDATFELETLQPGWQRIALIDGDASLSQTEPKEESIVCEDGYALLSNHPGKTTVTLHLTAPGFRKSAPNGGLHLKLPAATVKRLRISGIPDGSEARVNGAPAGDPKEGSVTVALAGKAGEAVIEIAAPTVEQPEQPSHWRIETQTLTTMTEGGLKFTNHVFAQADDGSGTTAQLVLPGNAYGLTVSGEDLADWSAAASQDGRRKIVIRWKSRGTLDRRLNVEYALPQSPLANQWKLEAPESGDGGESKTFYVILAGDGIELKGDQLKSSVESHRLPQWMRESIGSSPFVTAEAGARLSAEIHRLPEIPTAEAIITEADCSVRVVADGAERAEAKYTVSHQGPTAWKLELPPGVQLLSCEIDGARAHPLERAAGIIELILPAPPGAKPLNVVTLTYTDSGKPLDPVSGQMTLQLPRTELFIDHLVWNISIPSAYEPTAVNGNLTISPGSTADNRDERLVTLRKDLCRGERPEAEVYYQRLGLEK